MKTLLNALFTAVLCGIICGSTMIMTLEVLDLRARVEQLEEMMEPTVFRGPNADPYTPKWKLESVPICPMSKRSSC